MQQKTLARQVVFNGYGIHTAKFAEVILSPLRADSGLIFRSSTLTSKYIYPNVRGDERGTAVLFSDGSAVQTVEHLVSALAGLGVDNALIEIDGVEAPIKDGSAKFIVEQILSAGLQEQDQPKRFLQIAGPKKLAAEGKFILALPAENFKVNFLLDYDNSPIQTDLGSFDAARDDYAQYVAPARTYGFQEELEWLLAQNKAQGASLKNAVVVSDKGFSTALRFPDELVRHKILDFIGDIAAAGALPQAEFFVYKSGHVFNHRFVREVLAA
ncbi:MAG: UDP-3-O-acyl-N-acetylglucosamine deacetylase [Candidatus Margulisbacteria bacterium]|jgi:UDP-3-O-[3-hydroxymyristoyl] N-acetylglucosamine deacetylase|nr:UDP-3-O-acyl-N-acetylglucosamine deacetylase [Candidatus Margulisiibacteriota bacterium]